MTHYIYSAALDWLGRGYSLLPVISGTKYIVEGFAIENSITDQLVASWWFRENPAPYNLAVVCPPGSFILDFDDWQFYLSWLHFVKRFDDRVTRSYSEMTPSGGVHVFLQGDIPDNLSLKMGVEIKRHCVVAPSMLKGAAESYDVLSDQDIYFGSLDACFFFLSVPKKNDPARAARNSRILAPGKIAYIKGRLSIVEIFKKYYPRHTLKQRGRYYNCTCPFHADKNPSFFLDAQLNIFGCHACKARGDIINLYALAEHIDNNQAVDQLMMYAQ